ncbi:MAG: polysaccharide deacetylase family protein [Bacillota bacterium]
MKRAAFLLVFIILMTILLTGLNVASLQGESLKPILVVYDNPNLLSRDHSGLLNDFSVIFSEQLGHFNTEVDVVLENEYKDGMLEGYQYIFYLSLREKYSVNRALLKDIAETARPVVWYGEGIEELLNANQNIHLKFRGRSKTYHLVEYNEKVFNLGQNAGINLLLEPLSEEVVVYGKVSDGKRVYPLMANWKNYWFMSGLDTSGVKYLVFSDVLHEIFGEYHSEYRKVYLRIEDVSPISSPKNLMEIADYLYSKKIPFIIVLIPAYINPETGVEASITDKPEVIEAVRYMVERGGTVVLHGYTHQHYKEETGEGFEFWDAFEDRPLNVNYADYVGERVLKGIEICLENGLYPLAFEPPHYAMAQDGYRELKKYFSTVIGQLQTTDRRFASVPLPYEVRDTKRFNRFLPESLGYVELDGSYGVENILNNAGKLLIVRDAVTGVFFHPFMDMEYLEQIVEGLESMGYVFADLGKEDNWVRIGEHYIRSIEGNILYEGPLLKKEKTKSGVKEEEKKSAFHRSVEIIATFLAVFVGVNILRFIIIFFKVKKRQKKILFKEREL